MTQSRRDFLKKAPPRIAGFLMAASPFAVPAEFQTKRSIFNDSFDRVNNAWDLGRYAQVEKGALVLSPPANQESMVYVPQERIPGSFSVDLAIRELPDSSKGYLSLQFGEFDTEGNPTTPGSFRVVISADRIDTYVYSPQTENWSFNSTITPSEKVNDLRLNARGQSAQPQLEINLNGQITGIARIPKLNPGNLMLGAGSFDTPVKTSIDSIAIASI